MVLFQGLCLYPESLSRYHAMLATENLKAEPRSESFGPWHFTSKTGLVDGYYQP